MVSGMLKVGIVGATGYAGQELVRLLVQHPGVRMTALTSQTYKGLNISDVFPHLRGYVDLICSDTDINALSEQCDVLFIALPHGIASTVVTADVLSKCRIIDLGADFRLRDSAEYEKWYHTQHGNPPLLAEAVYGLCEWREQDIRNARLIANPGCYATAAALALMPLLKSKLVEPHTLIVDAKSGVSGAGRVPSIGSHFNECDETIKAYALGTHRHTPEIEAQLHHFDESIQISFTPHLVPMNRGILATSYASLKENVHIDDVRAAFADCYHDKPFVRLCPAEPKEGSQPETRWVKGSNFCDIGLTVDERTRRVIVVSALDNLIKGAAGQAVQNMNIACGLDQTTGLTQIPIFPA